MSDLVRLRALVEADLAPLHRWYQDPSLWDHLVGDFVVREEAEAVADTAPPWLTPSPTEVRLAIVDTAQGWLAGLVALAPIDPAAGEAEFQIFPGRTGDARPRPWRCSHPRRRSSTRSMNWGSGASGCGCCRPTRPRCAPMLRSASSSTSPSSPRLAVALVDIAVIAMRVTDAVFRERLGAYARRSVTR